MACRDSKLAAAEIVVLVTRFPVLQMLHRLSDFYSVLSNGFDLTDVARVQSHQV